ncbi:hypothetical protein AOHp86_12460 [Helicobacter pylori]|nr:hypothetical protein HPK22_00723 [Helicobacter pylori]
MWGIGKAFSGNKSDEEAPKERILNDEEILKKAQKIAKKELDEDAKLTASHDQYERMKEKSLIKNCINSWGKKASSCPTPKRCKFL